jgi:ABC-2 type transport system permease protein
VVTTDVATARAAPVGVAHNLRAVRVVLRREMIRFTAESRRAASMILQALVWLFIMGNGLGALVPATDGVDMKTFLFPGVVAMGVILTSMSSAASVVWDREFGFLREMLVAPVRRSSLVFGKVLGGAVLATAQGVFVLALAGFVGVPYHPGLMLILLGEMFLAGFAMTAFGVAIAARSTSMESFFGVMQMAIMPLMFLSGALFPLGNLPTELRVLTLLNPLTYVVDPMRQAVFSFVDASPQARELFNPGVSWSGWQVPVAVELLLVAVSGLGLLALATARFRKLD